MDDANREPGPAPRDVPRPTPRYVPGQAVTARQPLPPRADEAWDAVGLDQPDRAPQRAEETHEDDADSRAASVGSAAAAGPVGQGDAGAVGQAQPPRGYVVGLAVFTVASLALVAWLILGYSGGRFTWQMLVPLVPWAVLLLVLWAQVIRRVAGSRPR